MILNDYTDDFVERVRLEAAGRCLEAATFLQTVVKTGLSTSYPPASIPGQYPHGRTWGGRDGCVVTPSSVEEIAKIGYVRVGFTENAWYIVYLELAKRRLGLFSTYREIKTTLQRILSGSRAKITVTANKG